MLSPDWIHGRKELVVELVRKCRCAATGSHHVPRQRYWNSDYDVRCVAREEYLEEVAPLVLHLDLFWQVHLENDAQYYYLNGV